MAVRKGSKLIKGKDPEFRFLLKIDPAFEEWRTFAVEWLATKRAVRITIALAQFFVRYLHDLGVSKAPRALLDAGFSAPSLWDALALELARPKNASLYNDSICDFIDWVLAEKYSEIDPRGYRRILPHLRNPFPRVKKKTLGRTIDAEFSYLLILDPAFDEWQAYAAGWLSEKQNNKPKLISVMGYFFVDYLHRLQLDKNPKALLDINFVAPSLWDSLHFESIGLEHANKCNDIISDFIEWVLVEKYSEVDADGYKLAPFNLRNPFPRVGLKKMGKSSDVEFSYLLALDPRLEDWRALASEWLNIRRTNGKREALDKFIVAYLLGHDLERNPYHFLRRTYPKPPFVESVYGKKGSTSGVRINNCVHEFLSWVLNEKLSVEDGNCDRLISNEYHNPVNKLNHSGTIQAETLKAPLAYQFIRELRTMLAQGPNFGEWTWSQHATDSILGSDWYLVAPSVVNKDDPDCVWRKRCASEYEQKYKCYPPEVFELWSPVRAVALYLKLELPLRTFQVRMLDSGEADTWRYKSGKWLLNHSPLAIGSQRRPSQRGVFHRSPNEAGAGFYINTNKTADTNKPEQDKGYVIPWTHEPALFWLEKLRNWQETYNPVAAPTPWRDLRVKHLNGTPPGRDVMDERGACCFLFRDAGASERRDRDKPFSKSSLYRMWHQLLWELEKRCMARGETLDDGSPIRFVNQDGDGTYYPPHALRVSLITAYALDGGVSFVVLSKLIAGHARLIMTLYYTKAGKAHVTEIMQEAEKRILESEKTSYRRFLAEKNYQELESLFVFNSPDALKAVSQQESAASFFFEDKGICPVGGGLCDIGGDVVCRSGGYPSYGPVQGYPHERNCVRCRFFLTGPAFLPGLQAHANSISYKISECSERYINLEQQVKALEDSRLACEELGSLFTQSQDLERLNRHYEEEAEKANKVMMDFQAAVRLIDRSMAIANGTNKGGIPLVAAGTMSDIKYAFIETGSEILQLEVICENAVVYPEIDAGKATLRRSQILDAMLQMNGRPPIFFRLSPDEQLRVGNEVMKLIQARSGGLKEAVEFTEGKRLLAEWGLLEETVGLIEDKTSGVAFHRVLNFGRPSQSMLADAISA